MLSLLLVNDVTHTLLPNMLTPHLIPQRAMTASFKKLALERYVFDSQTKQPQNHFRALEKWLLFPASQVK